MASGHLVNQNTEVRKTGYMQADRGLIPGWGGGRLYIFLRHHVKNSVTL